MFANQRRMKGDFRARFLRGLTSMCFFFGVCLLLMQLVTMTGLVEVEVRVRTRTKGHQIKSIIRRSQERAMAASRFQELSNKVVLGNQLESTTPLEPSGQFTQVEQSEEATPHQESWEGIIQAGVNESIIEENPEETEPESGQSEKSEPDEEEEDELAPVYIEGGIVAYGNISADGKNVLLKPQIVLPVKPRKPVFRIYNSDKNFWPIFKSLWKKGWDGGPGEGNMLRASMIFSRGTVPFLLKGKQMLNSIGLSGCIGGAKNMQLECRRKLASHHGCKYESLKIQPAQFNMDSTKVCSEFFEIANLEENAAKQWLYKPVNAFHGRGIKLYNGPSELWKKLGGCKGKHAAIVMEYISRPATVQGGYKFDLRSYLLVGSLDPQLVFYADGFARKSDTVYNATDKRTTVHITNSVNQKKENHFLNFTDTGKFLELEMKFGPGFLDRAREYMKKTSVFLFKTTDTQAKKLRRFPGRFHLFAIDWIIDADGSIHLLEGNGYPLVTEYPIQGLTPTIWRDMVDLVLKIHVTPDELSKKFTVKQKFTYGKWSLIYNELEEQLAVANGQPKYNPCTIFP